MTRAAARFARQGAAAALAVAAAAGIGPPPDAPRAGGWLDDATARRVARNPPLGAVPADPTNRFAESVAAAELGHRLFFDARLSASGTVSCATCHEPARGFSDPRPLAVGEGIGPRHSMTVLNAAHQRWLTWDGRADTLWGQAVQPFETAHEMGSTRAKVLGVVRGDAALRDRWRAAFGEDVPPADAGPAAVDAAFAKAGKALAAYERKLTSGPSAYDRWWTRRAAGDAGADEELSEAERRGLALFFGRANCFQCHHGALFSDGEFHNIGMPPRGGGMPNDAGRYAVVERLRDDPFNAAGPHSDDREGAQARISRSLVNSPERWGEFRTPGLRNAAVTAPYMHAGQKATLADVVRFYSTLEGATQLDHHRESVLRRLDLSEREQADLVAFLGALTGPGPGAPWDRPPSAVAPAAATVPAHAPEDRNAAPPSR
jgi:cytochrome c peroxidase